MIDSKTLIALSRADAKFPAMLKGRSHQAITHMCNEIADFIEQQAIELTKLREERKEEIKIRLLAARLKNGEISIGPDALVFKDTAESIEQGLKEELEQINYADLGRLVAESPDGICHSVHYDEKWRACRQCSRFKACQKRAELLAGEK